MINIGSTNICPVVKFVGVQVIRDRAAGTITLTQTRYIEQLAEEYKGKFRLRSSPYGESKEERSAFDHLVPASSDETPLAKTCKTSYLSLLGKIVWPSTMTRVDCSEAVSVLCSMWPPAQRHYDLGLDVIGCLQLSEDQEHGYHIRRELAHSPWTEDSTTTLRAELRPLRIP